MDGSQSQLSICGTPLYSAPQLLKKKTYSAKVDTWACGIMLFELLVGKTPFHSSKMEDLLQKINDGRYNLQLQEPLTIECALFLTQCLQTNENDRISIEELSDHPYVQSVAFKKRLTILDTTNCHNNLSMFHLDPRDSYHLSVKHSEESFVNELSPERV